MSPTRLSLTRSPSRGKQPGIRLTNDIRQLWLLRILVPLKAAREYFEDHNHSAGDVIEFFGLPKPSRSGVLSTDQYHAMLRDAWRRAEVRKETYVLPAPLRRNLQKLAVQFGLRVAETRLLGLLLIKQFDPLVSELVDIAAADTSTAQRLATTLLGLPHSDVRRIVARTGRLARAGLICTDCAPLTGFCTDMDGPHFAGMYFDRTWTVSEMVDALAIKAPLPELALSDYGHLADDLTTALGHLKNALARRTEGVNILLHGQPGVGKTQLVRTLAGELGVPLFEITTTDKDDEAIGGRRRLSMLATCQRILATRQTLLLFDDVDEIFDDGNWFTGVRTSADQVKGWLNRTLESNPIPTIWIANRVSSLDPAFARRFDIVLHLEPPPIRQREIMVRRHAAHVLDEARIQRFAKVKTLSPATLRRAAKVVEGARVPAEQRGAAMERLVEQSLQVQLGQGPRAYIPTIDPPVYDPAFANTSEDVQAVADGLIRTGEGRLCLYGPPGTGKSAFGHWLGERLGRPVLFKKASDLLCPYVGQTERHIADAFAEAERDRAILQIDEIDSFLQDRRQARASWEATQVNEMLTQIEGFDGIFIASTNQMSRLDAAALRRFDAKIEFRHLRTDQAVALTRTTANAMGIRFPEDPSELALLTGLQQLAPGDFAAVARRHRFHPIASFRELVEALAAECRLKPSVHARRIGFV